MPTLKALPCNAWLSSEGSLSPQSAGSGKLAWPTEATAQPQAVRSFMHTVPAAFVLSCLVGACAFQLTSYALAPINHHFGSPPLNRRLAAGGIKAMQYVIEKRGGLRGGKGCQLPT